MRHLEGAPEAIALTFDQQRPAVPSYQGRLVDVPLPDGFRQLLIDCGQRAEASPFMTALALFGVLLWRWSGENDLPIGIPIANRNHPGTEKILGNLVNTLIFRLRIAPHDSFLALLHRVREMALDHYAHQDAPFEAVVERLNPDRRSNNPLANIHFAFENTPRRDLQLPELSISVLDGSVEPTWPIFNVRPLAFDLTLYIDDDGNAIRSRLAYATDVFERSSIEAMAAQFATLAAAAAAHPETRIADLPLIAAEERAAIIAASNGSALERRPVLITDCFAEWATRTPNAPCVTAQETLTYSQVDRRASALARALAAEGVGPEVRVGLCTGRTTDHIIGMLAILQAGGVFVPLDVSSPALRLAQIARDAELALIACDDEGRAAVLGSGLPILQIGAAETEHWHLPVDAGNAAYVLHTSGTSGKPKGVVIEHRNLAAHLAAIPFFDEPGWHFAMVSSLVTDLGLTSIFGALSTGGCVHLVPQSVVLDRNLFVREMISTDVLKITPSHLRALAGDPPDPRVLPRRAAVIGGERLDGSWVSALRDAAPACAMWDEYGPTETTVGVTALPIDRIWTRAAMGPPLSGSSLMLLDESLRPVPDGVPGEIYIGGRGVARGYFGRADLTAERFLPDPYARIAGARMYRTGDIAVRRAGGGMEMMGRRDEQLKVRGYRVEPEEAAAALRELPGIRDAMVFADGELYACVAVDAPETWDERAAKSLLLDRLPAYLVPERMVAMRDLPLAPSGKLDRKAARALFATSAVAESGQPPAGETELQLAKLWREVIGQAPESADSDFFQAGGHSLRAMQLIGRIREAMGVEIPVRTIFATPELRSIARTIDAARELAADVAAPPIVKREAGGAAPLSFAQQRLWFLDRLEKPDAAYNVPSAVRLTGRLDVDALRGAFEALLARHDALRTTFPEVDGVPMQIASASAAFDLPVTDLRGFAGDRETEMQRLVRASVSQPFDLARGPLFRAHLIRTAEDEWVLATCAHHIVSDAWSTDILIRELSALYEERSGGRSASLPELPIQYADFAEWQQRHLTPARLAAQLEFWKRTLAGAPELLTLPLDHARPAAQSFAGRQFHLELGSATAAGIAELARRSGATPFMTLLAAFAVVMSRYSGQDDLVIGSPLANRTHPETEPLIGFFVNMLPIRLDVAGARSFAEVLERVRAVCLDVYAHQDAPFAQIVEAVQPARSRSHTPLFQVVFSAEPMRGPLHLGDGVTVTSMDTPSESSKFDLLLLVRHSEQRLQATFEYDTALFREETIAAFAAELQRTIDALVIDAHVSIEALAADGDRAVRGPIRSYDTASIAELFHAQADAAPDAVAVVCGEKTATYGQLRERACALANRLRDCGVGPDVLVAVACRRSIDMVVALLATFEAGGAYVPLDPGYPFERLEFMLADSRAPVLLTQCALAPMFRDFAGTVLSVDALAPTGNAPRTRARVHGGNLCYAIYTSGSTGTPKGVLGVCAGALNRFRWMWETMPFGSEEVLCQKTALSFLDSLWEIFGPLLRGVPLHILSDDVVRDPERLVDALSAKRVTRIVLVPSLLRALLDVPRIAERLAHLRLWFVSGEALSPELARHFAHTLPAARLINLYGSSELSADVTVHELRGENPAAVPIGVPLANTTAYVLDPRLRPVPPLAVGELYIAGAHLARGYAHDAAMTAARFLPDPFAGDGSRMFRTGDLARAQPSGDLEYHGRADHQLKVRGYRIEPEEVELALRGHAAVQQAVVVAARDEHDDAHVVAHFVPSPGYAPAPLDLHVYLSARLPAHMVPSRFVAHAAMPLTPSGKLDRRALSSEQKSAAEPQAHARTIAPRDATELTVARIWEAVLGTEAAGVTDDFFTSGGHSLAGVRLLSAIGRETGCRIPLAALFEGARTVESLAAMVREGAPPAPWSPLVGIQTAGTQAPLFCVHPVGGNVLCYYDLARALGNDQPLWGLQARGVTDDAPPFREIAAMAAAYVDAIVERFPTGQYRIAGWSFGGNVAFEMARILQGRGHEVERLALIDTYNIDTAPEEKTIAPDLTDPDAVLLLEVLAPLMSEEARRDAHAIAGGQNEMEAVLRFAAEQHVLPAGFHPEEMRRILDVYRAHEAIAYTPQPLSLPSTEILLVYASETGSRDPEAQAKVWRGAIDGTPHVETLEGDHQSILQPPRVAALAALLSGGLS